MKKETWKVHPLDNLIRILAAILLVGIAFNALKSGVLELSAILVAVLCVMVLFPRKGK
jgi:hypothetical protein